MSTENLVNEENTLSDEQVREGGVLPPPRLHVLVLGPVEVPHRLAVLRRRAESFRVVATRTVCRAVEPSLR